MLDPGDAVEVFRSYTARVQLAARRLPRSRAAVGASSAPRQVHRGGGRPVEVRRGRAKMSIQCPVLQGVCGPSVFFCGPPRLPVMLHIRAFVTIHTRATPQFRK